MSCGGMHLGISDLHNVWHCFSMKHDPMLCNHMAVLVFKIHQHKYFLILLNSITDFVTKVIGWFQKALVFPVWHHAKQQDKSCFCLPYIKCCPTQRHNFIPRSCKFHSLEQTQRYISIIKSKNTHCLRIYLCLFFSSSTFMCIGRQNQRT